ncbi:uncharacterized protein LOC110186019 [Drosophila serrata]|uniref:uncharacterized protein LOC110186019 n=1 Tax=Drosophila serrata TaxID=7274 RepID=UPI000A1D306E|nr:uncharacterized protein LOC110186019 [Drosophila serrata]KAH8393663.1 hypothetical protein KR200_009154 [Drosophila serrata]
MVFTLVRQHLLSNRRSMAKIQGVPVRNFMPVAGPPRFPMSTVQRLIFGVGPLILMMIIPYWSILNLPRWSRMHLGLPPEDEEEESPPPPEVKDEQKTKDAK